VANAYNAASAPLSFHLEPRSTRNLDPKFREKQLERKLQRQLPNASIYSRATDNAERGRREISVGVRKLWMVQRIVKLSPKLQTTFLNWPV
jgi:hypothetical protein